MDKVDSVLGRIMKPEFNHPSEKASRDYTSADGDTRGECPLCLGRGLIISEDGDRARLCKCVKQRSSMKMFKNAKLSKSMLACTFDRFSPHYYDKNSYESNRGRSYYETAAIAYKTAKNFVAKAIANIQPDGILLTGNVGSGKTFLACCIANALIENGQETLFIVVPDLLDEIRATYDSSGHNYTEQELLDTARKVQYLILDDLGAHNYTDWVRNKLYSIINYRLNNLLPTVITTNLDLAELEEYLGVRTTSRIVQLCQAVQLYTDIDIRIQKRNAREQDKDHKGIE